MEEQNFEQNTQMPEQNTPAQEAKKSKNGWWVAVLILIIVIVAIWYWARESYKSSLTPQETQKEEQLPPPTPQENPAPAPEMEATDTTTSIENQLNSIDVKDLDQEFKSIDNDLNSLQ